MKIQELYDELRIPYRQHGESPHVTEGWVGIVCPFCGIGTNRFGLGFNLRTGWMSCWKCGPHRLSEVIAQVTGLSPQKSKALTQGLDRIRLPPRDDVRGKLVLPSGLGELSQAHRGYLSGRGFDPDELIETWKIQGIGIHERFSWRIFIPIHQDREVVSWTTRLITDDCEPTLRYRGARRTEEVYHRGSVLYGEDKAKHGIVIHEGPFDVWATGPGAVCTCGTGFSRGQIRRMGRFPVRAVCFDSDPAAQRRARSLADDLSVYPGETYCVRLDAKDAALAMRERPEELRELRRRFLV